ncbi:nuclear transport factor 2 family protein [Variovorax sp. E3]|uniref:nuclear transport factor 2 family protein n=1 Tax=Variovorax sp. E3 TaxID=1914993 RepID=UPI0018DE7EE3|nr:nuclear transport factor 2 family protein [Variovorax sp. E3]
MSFKKNVGAISDYNAVHQNIKEGYVQGLIEGNLELILSSFHTDATMFGFFEGALLGGSIRNLSEYVKQYGPAKNMTSRIDVLDMTETLAVVRLELENAACGKDYTDFHALIKIEGKWRIVSKMFHMYG